MAKRKYLENTELFECEAKILRVTADERGQYAVLDATIFYPQGGGQPSDIGYLIVGEEKLPITFVANVENEIRHYGDVARLNTSMFPLEAKLRIDSSRRLANARTHTAGHLVASLLERRVPTLKGVKGFHFPEGSYVEFAGEIAESDTAGILEKLNADLAEAIRGNAELKAVRESDTHRTVAIGDLAPTPCGGTHVSHLGKLGNVVATKLKKKSGQVRVSYSLP